MWWAKPSDFSLAEHTYLAGLLDQREKAAAAFFLSPKDRQRYVIGHGLVRVLLSKVVNRPPQQLAFEQICVNCAHSAAPAEGPDGRASHSRAAHSRAAHSRAPHGKPQLAQTDIHFNLSHARNRVLIAISQSAPVGVDVEHLEATQFPGFDEVALSDGERDALLKLPTQQRDQARASLWVRKEAVLKASGWGMSFDPALLALSSPAHLPEPTRTLLGQYHLADLNVGSAYAAAVAHAAAESGSTLENGLNRIEGLGSHSSGS